MTEAQATSGRPGALTVFFRNDDVGTDEGPGVSRALEAVTEAFLAEGVPISHGVVPARVGASTVEWLRRKKQDHPRLVGIDQHGYRHVRHVAGEFRGRPFGEQRADIAAGLQRMDALFDGDFSRCFTVPWCQYDRSTKRACDELGFAAFSADVHPSASWTARAFVVGCRALGVTRAAGRTISYHRTGRHDQRGFRIPEVSVSIDLVKDDERAILLDDEVVDAMFARCRASLASVGFMLHHRAWDSAAKIGSLRRLVRKLRADPSIRFDLLEDIAGNPP